MMTESWKDLAAAYALGALDDQERASFEAELQRDADLRSQVDEYLEAAAGIGGSLELRPPPSGLKERILQRARESSGPTTPAEAEPARARRPSLLPWVGLAAALAGLLWMNQANRELSQEASALRDELGQMRSLLSSAEVELARFDSIAPLLAGSDLRFAALTGDGLPPGLRLVWNAERGVLLVAAANLPPAPDGRTYQLWGIRGTEAPVSLGTFQTGAEGTALLTLSSSEEPDFDLSALTEEPEGGSDQPTTTPFLAGPWTTAE